MEKQIFIKKEHRSGNATYTNTKFIDGFINIKKGQNPDEKLMNYIKSKPYFSDVSLMNDQIEPIFVKCMYTNMGNRFFEIDGTSYVRLDRIEEVTVNPGSRVYFKCIDVDNKNFAILDEKDEKPFLEYLNHHSI